MPRDRARSGARARAVARDGAAPAAPPAGSARSARSGGVGSCGRAYLSGRSLSAARGAALPCAAMIHIRPAEARDQAALGRFGAALMRQHHAADPKRFLMTERPEAGYGRFLVSQIGDPESLVLVAEHGGEVIG